MRGFMRWAIVIGVLAVLCLTPVVREAVAARVFKLATLAPDGSVWDKVLQEMSASWRESSEGRVSLRIYPGGVAGDDPDVVRKMRIGQLHAGSLTLTGLADIDPYFEALAIPLFFASDEELFYVLSELEEEVTARLEAKGFVFLHWGHGGWVHLFSKDPIRTVEDLRRQKFFVWAGQDELVQWWKKRDFQPVALAATDIMTGLQTGMIDALPTTPLAGLGLQWFRQTPYMLDLPLGPLLGATLATKREWEKISEEDRAAFLEAASQAQMRLEVEVPKQDLEAVEQMVQRGLTVTAGSEEEWRAAAEDFATSMRGNIVPADAYERVVAVRDAYRRSQQEKGPS